MSKSKTTPVLGCSIYIDWYPCADCARAIIQSGIVEIIIDGRGDIKAKEEKWNKRWEVNFAASKEMLEEAGVHIMFIK